MFEALADLETTSQHSSNATDPEDDDSEDETVDEDAVEEHWQKVSFKQEPDAIIVPPQVPPPEVITSSSESNAPPSFVQPSDLRDPATFFFAHGYDAVPVVPTTDRALDELLESGDIWSMSGPERRRLHDYWVEAVRADLRQNQLEEFERLRRTHTDKLRKYNEGKDEVG
jgi:hypothetical protein